MYDTNVGSRPYLAPLTYSPFPGPGEGRVQQPGERGLRARDVPAARGLHALRGGIPPQPQRHVDHEAHVAFAGQGHLLNQQAGADQEVVLAEPLGAAGRGGRAAEGSLRYIALR